MGGTQLGRKAAGRVIITPIHHGLDDIIGVSIGHRSPGLHMSQIYGDLAQDLEPKRFVRGAPMDMLRVEAGLALETVLEKGLRDRWCAERPPEQVTAEGIAYSPDMIIFDGGSPRLGECKLTWMSSKDVPREPANTFPKKFDKYLWQMKAYCYHLEMNEARLIAYFVNGTGRAPELMAWDIEFTMRELKENWSMLINHARHKRFL